MSNEDNNDGYSDGDDGDIRCWLESFEFGVKFSVGIEKGKWWES